MAFVKLLALCSFMFACSMAVGCLPLVVSFSHRHLRTLTTFGVGLLIGTAFIVIIPEGIHTLYTPPAGAAIAASHHVHSHSSVDGPGLLDADYWQRWWQGSQLSSIDAVDDHEHGSLSAAEQQHQPQHNMAAHDSRAAEPAAAMVHIVAAATAGEQRPGSGQGRLLLQHATEGAAAAATVHDVESAAVHEESEDEEECVFEPAGSGYIGASLALGFVVMLIVDRLSGDHSHGPPLPHPDEVSRSGLSQRQPLSSSGSGSGSSGSKRTPGVARRTVSDSLAVSSSDRDRTDDDDMDEVVQRISIIHIAAANTRQAATAASAAIQTQDVGREREMTAEERERERERQRVEREKERERAHGYAPYASGSLPSSADPSASLSSTVASSNATIGILVHSFVDGIALGAISLSSDSSLEMVVFLAILLHKGPAALGLVSFLMYQGRSQLYIRTQLTLFSLCAPVAALLTFALLASPLPSAAVGLPSASSPSALGLMLLFSGGTFLFTIAVHIMPTIRQTHTQHSHGHTHSQPHSHHHRTGGSSSSEHAIAFTATGSAVQDDERDSELGPLLTNQQQHGGEQLSENKVEEEPLEWRYVLVLIGGILSPLLFSAGHSHAHG